MQKIWCVLFHRQLHVTAGPSWRFRFSRWRHCEHCGRSTLGDMQARMYRAALAAAPSPSRREPTREAVIGGAELCGHGTMRRICPECLALLDRAGKET
jgi:hypothetical protein